jgi:AcrR family transcriptional regulator
VRKGEATRIAILDRALRTASSLGLQALTVGELAKALKLSKSGLFAHFGSKEQLEVEVLRAAGDRFVKVVLRPAIRQSRGEPRIRALFENWLAWSQSPDMPGGCVFVQATAELDGRPGPARDALVQMQRDWMGALAEAARIAQAEGHFAADLDPEQFAFEMYGIMMVAHHHARLLGDPKHVQLATFAFERLLSDARSGQANPHHHGTPKPQE